MGKFKIVPGIVSIYLGNPKSNKKSLGTAFINLMHLGKIISYWYKRMWRVETLQYKKVCVAANNLIFDKTNAAMSVKYRNEFIISSLSFTPPYE